MTPQQTRLRLWLVRIIMVLLPWNLCMPVITVFWHNLGMNQNQIGLSQMVFTIVMIVFNLVTGHWADHHGRRAAALIGLTITGTSFLAYAFATNFWWVILMELTTGIGMAFASGADTSLHRHYCDKLGIGLQTDRSRINLVTSLVGALAMLAGGYLGSRHLRLTMALAAIPYLIAALLALGLREVQDPPKKRAKLSVILRDIHANPRLRWRIIANTTAREVTHSAIWVFTPLMVATGVPVQIVGLGWALQYAAQFPGGWLALMAAKHSMRASTAYALGMAGTLAASLVLCLWPNAVTVIAGFFVLGIMRNWAGSLIAPLVTQAAHPRHITTTESAADTVSRLVYAPLVWACGWASDFNLAATFAVTLLVFTGPAILTTIKLRREE